MTILSVAQSVAANVGIDIPDGLVAETGRTAVELRERLAEATQMIASSAYWRTQMAQATLTGDDSTEDFPLEDDFKRFLPTAKLWSSSLTTPLEHIEDIDRWLAIDVQSTDFVVNAWAFYQDQIHVKPALATGVTAKYWYQRNTPILAVNGTTRKTAYTVDTDYPSFTANQDDDERLLKLCARWMWKEQKGRAYQEDMASYGLLLEKMIAQNGGPRMIVVGTARMKTDARIAYPTNVS